MAYSPTQPASMLSAVGSWLASGPERAFKGTEAALVTRPSWTLGFTAAVQCLKAAAWAVPRNVPAIRAVTDHSIPGALLPTGVTLHKRVLVAPADPSSGVPALFGEVYRLNPPAKSQGSSSGTSNDSNYPSKLLPPYTYEESCRAKGELPRRDANVILYAHGGAFCCCTSATHRRLLAQLCKKSGCTVVAVNYRRPPEHACPVARDDLVRAFDFLTSNAPGMEKCNNDEGGDAASMEAEGKKAEFLSEGTSGPLEYDDDEEIDLIDCFDRSGGAGADGGASEIVAEVPPGEPSNERATSTSANISAANMILLNSQQGPKRVSAGPLGHPSDPALDRLAEEALDLAVDAEDQATTTKRVDEKLSLWGQDPMAEPAKACERCDSGPFSLLRRRHHCRRCCRAVCGKCSPLKAEVHGWATPQRVCYDCADDDDDDDDDVSSIANPNDGTASQEGYSDLDARSRDGDSGGGGGSGSGSPPVGSKSGVPRKPKGRHMDPRCVYGVPVSRVVFGGDSAGGGLAVSALLHLRDRARLADLTALSDGVGSGSTECCASAASDEDFNPERGASSTAATPEITGANQGGAAISADDETTKSMGEENARAIQGVSHMPAGAFLLSPWVDLSDDYRGGTWVTNGKADFLPPDLAELFADAYAGPTLSIDFDAATSAAPSCREMRRANPALCPSHASLAGLPPLLLEVGGAEVLLGQVSDERATSQLQLYSPLALPPPPRKPSRMTSPIF